MGRARQRNGPAVTQDVAEEDAENRAEALGAGQRPSADRTLARMLEAPTLLYAAYRWFVLTGAPPTPQDWEDHDDGWPTAEQVYAFFAQWEDFLTATGITDSPMVEQMRTVAEQTDQAQRDLHSARRELERERARLARREEKLRNKLDEAARKVRTAQEKTDAARDEHRQAARDLERERRAVTDLRDELADARRQETLSRQLAARHTTQAPAGRGHGAPVYRCHLPLSPGNLDDVLAEVARWVARGAHADAVAAMGPGAADIPTGQPGTALQLTRAAANGHELAVITYTEPFGDRSDLDITTVISAYRADGQRGVSCELLMHADRLGAHAHIAPPRLPALLCGALDVLADGAWPRGRAATRVSREQACELAEFVLSEDRALPLVLISTQHGDGAPLIDPDEAARTLCGLAHVAVADRGACFELTALLGHQLSVWNGAARCYLPGSLDERHSTVFVTPGAAAAPGALTTLFGRLARASATLDDPCALREARDALADQLADPAPREHMETSPGDQDGAGAQLEARLAGALHELDEERRRAGALAHALAASAAANAPDQAGRADRDEGEPATVLDATRRGASAARHLRFSDRAYRSAADSPFRRPADILAALARLDELAGAYASGALGRKLADVALDLGLDWRGGVSELAAGRHPELYTFTHQGVRLKVGPHVVVGNGAGAGRCGRIYLCAHDGDERLPRGLIVAHIGRHLPDSTT